MIDIYVSAMWCGQPPHRYYIDMIRITGDNRDRIGRMFNAAVDYITVQGSAVFQGILSEYS